MPNKIHITMFGQFSISYRGKRLCENEYRGSKMISLLEYLISQRGREITQNELIDLLWSDSKNPANALKTLVHRTRAMLDQSDEKMHANLIRAFVAMGDYERAAKQYDYIRAYLMEQYGAAPGAHLTELYELTVKPRNDVQNNLDAVIGDLTGDDSKEQKGVFYCQYEIFKYIFRLYKRESQRIESKLSICLVSAVDSSKNSFSINNSLRMRDVYTRYSRSQYLLLLLDADKSSFDGIEERIMTRFRRSKTMDSVNVKFDFKEI